MRIDRDAFNAVRKQANELVNRTLNDDCSNPIMVLAVEVSNALVNIENKSFDDAPDYTHGKTYVWDATCQTFWPSPATVAELTSPMASIEEREALTNQLKILPLLNGVVRDETIVIITPELREKLVAALSDPPPRINRSPGR